MGLMHYLRPSVIDERGSNANLVGTILRFAGLSGANLSGANLTDADLFGAKLTDADLTGADLTGASEPPQRELRGVVWTNATCSDGTNADDNNGTCEGHW